ncbi:MAG: DNA-3-methyladenine glycosylase [Bacteroidales bacterium]|jgi:DNA-3-methyladenine glycosylase|nr:DNA-3-methyladenine glycosylase [Bacteroidales bacterium]
MSNKRLLKEFYLQNAKDLAPALIGKVLCRKMCKGKIEKLRITETECYFGFEDTASHAHKGKTNRNAPMFEEGGITYIYLCYGVHNLLNIVSGKQNHPEAVLIRGVEGFNGPGKLTKYLKIMRNLNAESLITSNEIWIEDDGVKLNYITSVRVGIDYADIKDREKKWRFIAQGINQ